MSLSFTEKTTEELEARHRKEQKELAAKLMALKKSVSKGDKRKKKEVAAEIAVLESQLNERQEAESKQLKESNPASTEDASDNIASAATHAEVAEDIQAIGDSSSDTPAPIGGLYGAGVSNRHKTGGKKSKAKARQQRRAEEMKRMQEEAEKEAEGMVDIGQVETEAIEKLVSTDGLYVQQIRADGHCLYSAFADQISTYHGQSLTYTDLRQRTAQYMREHRDDFIPFMVHDNGNMFTESDFEAYCHDIEDTAVWGGQQEITALSHVLEAPVYVYQMGSPVLRIGDGQYTTKEPVRLSYHRHAYGLGEHYNSLRKN